MFLAFSLKNKIKPLQRCCSGFILYPGSIAAGTTNGANAVTDAQRDAARTIKKPHKNYCRFLFTR